MKVLSLTEPYVTLKKNGSKTIEEYIDAINKLIERPVKDDEYVNDTVVATMDNKMISDIYSDAEWKKFLTEYNDVVKCYILRTNYDDKEIAFVYLYNESGSFDIVSIHGGGWDKSIALSLLYYRGLILMIETLLVKNVKVRTTCTMNNTRAYKFLRSVGFVKYRFVDDVIYMWINEKRLMQSSVYKRYCNQS